MVCCVHSAGLNCLEGFIVCVEVDVANGLPGMDLVGFLGSEVKEARERVNVAIRNSGYAVPLKRVTLNLAPANIRKSGTGFDLPIAIGILRATECFTSELTSEAIFIGELNLDGRICPVNGILPLVLAAKKAGYTHCFVPEENGAEAAVVEGMEVYPLRCLKEAVEFLQGERALIPLSSCKDHDGNAKDRADDEFDLKYVQGQKLARRGLEIAAAGMHNLLLLGPPGAGKTMLSKCIPSILPPLTREECLEVSSIYSIAGKLTGKGGLLRHRPFVSPHHTVTDVALAGGGRFPKAGLVAQAHKGVLFLDEMPEFHRNALEILRQPLEDHRLMISRNGGSYTYPADFMLVGAMNPCPCGAYPDLNRCRCTVSERKRYLSRLSRPLMDRMDLCIEVKDVDFYDLTKKEAQESSEAVRKRVEAAQQIQLHRFGRPQFNARMSVREVERFCKLGDSCASIMEAAFRKCRLSARGYHRVLKVARTIADLAGMERIREEDLLEALLFKVVNVSERGNAQ